MFSHIDDDSSEEKHDNKRRTRNLSEKKRRDHFNLLVNELSAIVSTTNRKMDKSMVLKSTIGFLKNHNEVAVRSKVHEISEDWKPSVLSNEEFTHLVLEALDRFIVVFSSSGKILYTSEGITTLLGYLPTDLLNTTIYELANEDEHTYIYNLLQHLPVPIRSTEDTVANENEIQFHCHIKRGELDFRDAVSYEDVEFTGFFRDDIDMENFPISRPKRCGVSTEFEAKGIFVATCRICRPQLTREMSIQGCSKGEFTSRHSLEWKFLFLDYGAAAIIGYFPFEVLGTSGFDYCHFDDLEQVVECHNSLKLKGEGVSCYYRFLTKGQQWLWVQTRYYITYHQWTSKPEFVMCTHRVVNYTDVIPQMRRNNGKVEDVMDVNDSADSVERQLNTSASSMMITSPMSTRSVRSRKNNDIEQYWNNKFNETVSEDTTNSDGVSSDHQYSASKQNLMSRVRPYSVKASPKRHTTFQTSGSCTKASSENYTKQSTNAQTFQALSDFSTTPAPTLIVTSPQPNHDMKRCDMKSKDELQQIIVHQQDQLRHVSEQLLMVRYGASIGMAVPVASVSSVPLIDLPSANVYHHQHHPQQPPHHSPAHSLAHHHSSASPLAMQVDRDLVHQPLHYESHRPNICADQQMQHAPTLNPDNEIVSYMQLQPVTFMQTNASSATHHQVHANYPQQYVHLLNRRVDDHHSGAHHHHQYRTVQDQPMHQDHHQTTHSEEKPHQPPHRNSYDLSYSGDAVQKHI